MLIVDLTQPAEKQHYLSEEGSRELYQGEHRLYLGNLSECAFAIAEGKFAREQENAPGFAELIQLLDGTYVEVEVEPEARHDDPQTWRKPLECFRPQDTESKRFLAFLQELGLGKTTMIFRGIGLTNSTEDVTGLLRAGASAIFIISDDSAPFIQACEAALRDTYGSNLDIEQAQRIMTITTVIIAPNWELIWEYVDREFV